MDTRYIAYGLELGLPVVTDDKDMTALAKTFNSRIMRTMQLLKIMHDAGHVDMNVIDSIVAYWRYMKDTPARMSKDYKRFFGKPLP